MDVDPETKQRRRSMVIKQPDPLKEWQVMGSMSQCIGTLIEQTMDIIEQITNDKLLENPHNLALKS